MRHKGVTCQRNVLRLFLHAKTHQHQHKKRSYENLNYIISESIMKTQTFVLLMLSLTHAALAGFGKTPDLALKPNTGRRRKWSSTGMEGLDHSVTGEVGEVKRVNQVKKNALATTKNESRHPFEHHPFASGAFTVDPPEA